MTDKTKEALVHYEAALKEAFPSGATGDVFHHWNEARKALVEESSGTEQPDMNLNCKSVQARLATSWGYVKAEQQAQPQTDQSVTPEYLEWLDSIQPRHGVGGNEAWNAGVAWAKAQPQQETVACANGCRGFVKHSTPAQRTWVGFTDEEIIAMRHLRDWTAGWTDITYTRAIEAKLKEKNSD